jgi:hypothetical protein
VRSCPAQTPKRWCCQTSSQGSNTGQPWHRRAPSTRSAGSSLSQSHEPASEQCGRNRWLAALIKATVRRSFASLARSRVVVMPSPPHRRPRKRSGGAGFPSARAVDCRACRGLMGSRTQVARGVFFFTTFSVLMGTLWNLNKARGRFLMRPRNARILRELIDVAVRRTEVHPGITAFILLGKENFNPVGPKLTGGWATKAPRSPSEGVS